MVAVFQANWCSCYESIAQLGENLGVSTFFWTAHYRLGRFQTGALGSLLILIYRTSLLCLKGAVPEWLREKQSAALSEHVPIGWCSGASSVAEAKSNSGNANTFPGMRPCP